MILKPPEGDNAVEDLNKDVMSNFAYNALLDRYEERYDDQGFRRRAYTFHHGLSRKNRDTKMVDVSTLAITEGDGERPKFQNVTRE